MTISHYTAPGPVPSTAALEALWQAFEARYDGGLYDLGDLDTDAGAARVIIRRPGEMRRADAEAGAWILRHLGFSAGQVFYSDDQDTAGSWAIKVGRYA